MARLYCGNFSNAPDGPGCKGHLLFLFKAWSWDVFVSVEKGERALIESMKECLTIQFRKSLIWDATAGIPAGRKGVMQWQRNENTKLHENTNFYENSLFMFYIYIYIIYPIYIPPSRSLRVFATSKKNAFFAHTSSIQGDSRCPGISMAWTAWTEGSSGIGGGGDFSIPDGRSAWVFFGEIAERWKNNMVIFFCVFFGDGIYFSVMWGPIA